MEDFPGYDSGKRYREQDGQLRDLAAVLATPEGFRVLCGILKNMGLGYYVPNDPGAIALYNEGERLLRDAARADVGAATRLCAAIRGIEIN